MKSKIILRQLHNEPIKQKINELGNMTQTEALLSNSMNSYHDEIYEFNNPQYQDRKASISDLVIIIANQKKISPDTLQLYLPLSSNIHSPLKKLNDTDNLTTLLTDPNCISTLNSWQKNDFIILYYSINNTKIKISVDFYQMKIEKIYIKLATTCSVLLLKHIINSKLNQTLPVNSQKIFGLGLVKISEKTKKYGAKNKEFNDDLKLVDIINCYDNTVTTNQGTDYSNFILRLLLVRKNNNKLQMGLNFKFNYFKNVTKINFNEGAPKYCECSDGLNLFSYCRNPDCVLYNKLFVCILGYGCYEIIRETFKLKCPQCLSSKLIEVKNIGLINSKWYYKGILNGQKQNIFEGDGITIDDQLYILQEAKINIMIYKLYIEIKPHFVKKDKNNLCDSKEDIEESNLDDVSLYVPPNDYKTMNTKESDDLSVEKFNGNGVKIINNDDEWKSMDVLLDGREKINCGECLFGNIMDAKMNQNDCHIF